QLNEEETAQPSYRMVETPPSEGYQPSASAEARPARQEAAVKGITPDQPPPIAQPRPEPPAGGQSKPAEGHKQGIIQKILSWFRGDRKPEVAMEQAPTATPRQPTRDIGRRGGRGRREGQGRERPERGERSERTEGRGPLTRPEGEAVREAKRPRTDRGERPERGPRPERSETRGGEAREPRQPRPARAPAAPAPAAAALATADAAVASEPTAPGEGAAPAFPSESGSQRGRRNRRGGRRERGERGERKPEEGATPALAETPVEAAAPPRDIPAATETLDATAALAVEAVPTGIEPGVEQVEATPPALIPGSAPMEVAIADSRQAVEALAPIPAAKSAWQAAPEAPQDAAAPPAPAADSLDLSQALESSGLVLVETDPERVQARRDLEPVAAEVSSPQRRRPRPASDSSDEPLIQIETRK
ncbi:MAG: hypothetical protein ACM37V_01980, partial [Gemmatimonadota bacterium]